MRLGVDYYPHYFEDSDIEKELDNILALNANSIRIGDFIWQLIEPRELEYDFSYFKNLVEIANAKGIDVMVCTPTSTFPAWLKNKHPDVMIVDENLNPIAFGGRREYCYNSDNYLKYAKKITQKMVEEFRDFDNVINFQVDNEFGHENSDYCYCDNCRDKFRKYLEDKFKTIENLNKKCGNIFWSKSYAEFNEIEIPRKTITYHNPSMLLEWDRFRSYSINKFGVELINVIKENKYEHQEITHNFFPGFFNLGYDQNKLSEYLDFVSYDNYPVWGGLKEPVEPAQISLCHDYIRGLKNKNFWVVEQIMGAQGHDVIGYLPRPNQSKMWSYHAFAHGCENMFYFSYRTTNIGQEQFCYGLVDQDNMNRRRYHEAQEFFGDINKYSNELKNQINARVAVVYDYDNISHWKRQRQSSNFDFMNEILRIYRAFYNLNQNIDVISTEKSFKNYDVIILPVMQIFDEKLNKKLEEFAKEDKVIIFTYRSGIKDRNANIYLGKTPPSIIEELAGINILEVESLQSDQSVDILVDNKICKVDTFREILELTTAEKFSTYLDIDFKDQVAVSLNSYENSKVFYIGCGIDKVGALEIAKYSLNHLNVKYEETSDDLEIVTRGNIKFYINHSNKEMIYKSIKLEPYEVLVLDIN